MTVRRILRRAGGVAAASTALVMLGTTSASAHHCYIPMYSLQGPTSVNWLVITAEEGAAMFGNPAECDAQVEAGYAALREAGLPLGIKIFEKATIGTGEPGKGKGAGAAKQMENGNAANGKGLEFFAGGSTLADEMLETFVAAAQEGSCGAPS